MEIGLAVGGAFLSSALNVLFDRLAPEGDLFKMFQKQKNDVPDLKKLGMTLLGLQAVLSDAEKKQASNRFVSRWLNGLRRAVDSAENLMEEVNYEVLRLKVEGQHQNLTETINQQVSDLNLCLSDDFFLKLEDTIKTLEALEKQIGYLGLKKLFDSGKPETRPPSTSLVDESDIFGRRNEIEGLIDRLLSEDANGKNLTVVPIVGIGGVGKTTLAKVVYNDEKVKDHFDLKAWICVSETYDAFRITKGLLQEIGSKVDDNLNQLQVKLKESLKGKKFLIVLDDVWNDNYNDWDDLRNLFVQGDIGSKIIVTTRKESVALTMGRGAINVGTLSSEVSWALFKRHSLENRGPEEHSELEEVGKQIAHKCKGLPLALKTLAGFLRSKSKVDEWRNILRSEIWELPSCSNGILPALMLSYNDLPAHLKPCFAYCAIYPKGYPFRKEQVIHLWISNGLEHQLHSGNQCFLELRSRSLFERVPESSKWNPEVFLMHDLVNDLAQIASSKLCIRLEENEGSHMLEQSRHMSYSMSDGDFEKLKPLYKLEQLRTLLPINIQSGYPLKLSKRVLHNIFPRLTSLRALSLSRYEIVELPNDLFIKLKLLKFLDLSRTEIKKLPDSICVLYNLEILLLSSCGYLEELPPQMEKLINLHHLDISGTSHLKMPLQPSKLKSLHVLVGAEFLLDGRGVSRMEDLGELHNLYGSLSILELQNVVDRREALKAKMREKDHVEKLSLEWSESIADNSQTERDVLDEKLVNGRKEWSLQRLPCLRDLLIVHNGSDEEILDDDNWQLPCSIRRLTIGNLKTSSSQILKSVTSLRHLTSLQYLRISSCDQLQSLAESALPSSLSKLTIYQCPNLQSLAESALPSSLSQLAIYNCPNLQSLPVNGMPSSISKLSIFECLLLKPLLEFEKGEYWSKIAHISEIYIDGECL